MSQPAAGGFDDRATSAPAQLLPATLAFDATGTPVSERYGDVYHSSDGGQAQARHVFLEGNDLPRRWRRRERFVILETGFGLGLNFLSTWQMWLADCERCRNLEFVSVEKHPFPANDLARAHAVWPEFAALSGELTSCWPPLVPGSHRVALNDGQVVLRLVFGDALEVLPELDVRADALFLDGFSPALNPDLWSADVCQILARKAVPGATLATWSVAGHVRRALTDAGFVVERRAGFSRKRQMLVGVRSADPPPALDSGGDRSPVAG